MNNEFIESLDVGEESAEQLDRVFSKFDARVGDKTYSNRRTSITQFVEFSGVADLTRVDSVVVDDWVHHLLNDGYAPRSARTKTYAVSAVFNELVTRGFVEENPVEEVDVDDLSQTRQEEYHTETNQGEYLSVAEFETLVENAGNLRDEVMIRLLWQTGVRVAEAADIRLNDIDQENRSIKIRNAKSGRYAATGTRTVYYDRSFELTLTKYLNGYRTGFVGSVDAEDTGHLLVSSEKYSLHKEYLTAIVAETADEAGIQEVMYTNQRGQEMRRVNAHILRKSYGVHRTKNGMPIAYLSELMGHADISVTQESYLHFRDDDIEEAERRYSP